MYAIVYTVDFHWEVDGKMYEFSITGGDGISFSNLVEILGVVDDARSFINSVENIEFSNSELVSTSKAEEDITVGQIKEKLGLECEYSAELTEKEINKINSKEIHAGDWTLISLKPFTSEETLTVTMTNGEQFTIKVTDAQLKKTVIDAKGDTWEITVTYGKDAQIPDGAELRVHEITEATEHEAYVTKTQEVLGREIDDSNDRFFDISIIDKDGNEIQPAAKVSVEIHLLDTEIIESMQVVHFGETPELMEVEHDPVSLNFLTDGFSVFAVVVVESEEGSYVFHGEGYTITITHTAEAKIPLGTILTVEEIDPESDEYIQRLGQAWYEVNQEYFEVEEMRKNYNEGIGDLPELPLINLDHARFFNISLMYENEEIEPEVPVQVEIAYDDGMTMTGEAVSGVVHYMKDAVELIDEVNTVTEGSNVLAFKYEQANISDTGTYVGQKTYDEVAEPVVLPAPEPMQYPMLQKKATTLKELKTAGNGEDKEGAKGEKKGEDADLTAPIATKTLTPNKAGNVNDGTYTLELAVDGRAKSSTTTEIKKSNVLIVMDRSSSMINNIATNDVTQVAHYDAWSRSYYSGAYGYNNWSPTEGVTYYGQIYSNGQNRYRELFYNNGQFYYHDSQGVTTATTTSYTGNIYTSKTRTRLDEEQEALDRLIYDLLAKNGEGATDEGVSLEDIIEISVISFAKDRMDENDGAPHSSSEQDWSTEYNDLIEAVNDQYAPSGTNWDQALRYAMDKINKKKQDPTQAGEDYYLVFLTDGEPTATMNEHSGAVYYGSTAADYMPAYEAARNYVRDKSGIAEAEDIHFYGIMTWATNNIMRDFLKRLVNVGNGNVDNETDYTTEAVDEDGVDDYYYDADSLTKLEEAFNNIFNLISNNIAYEQVSITDGLTTDAMTTTLVNGSASGFQYTVYKDRVVNAEGKIVSQGTPVYTVTATDGEGGEPNVSFYIDGHEYTGNDVQKKTHEYNELQDDGTTLVPKTKYYYSVTVGEGENAHEYKMTLAEKTGDTLSWDLAAIGALEDGYTYAVSFTVWPDQDAYDYVAALNNGLKKIKDSNGQEIEVKWNTSVETDENKVTDSNGKSYWKGGALPAYPSIIKYTDGTYAVLTNTDQSLKYTIVKTETVNGEPTVVYDGPYNPDLPTPDPMPLTGTASQLEKVWNINRDPSILYKYLYESRDEEGKPVAFDIGFEIDRDGEIYKEIHLPGTATVTDDDVSYDWSAYESEDLVEYNGKTFSKRWSQDFSIATGLMLSEAQMDARNLDKSLYDDKKFFFGNTWYYILESGHDFKISEPAVGYEFDFEEPTYHPMLVDGVLMDVKFTTEDGTKRISGMKALEIDTPTGKSALTVFNTLRGYINVKKKVVDYDGTTGLTTDNTEFTFEVELTNAMPVFEGDHIPWYGINGLYYHDVDADDDYYQAEYINGKLQVTTEEGGPYEGVGTTFNPDYAGEQTITYLVDGQPVSVKICGNQMTPAEGNDTDGYKKVTGTAKITQTETLYIANVPVNTHYTIKETGLAALGYQLIDIQRQVGTNDPTPEAGNIENGIEGEIVQNTETLVTYTNKCLVTNITIQKTDVDGKGLEGAVFRLVKVGQDGHSESDASLIESVSGLTTVSKTVNEETKTYSSAFESNGEAQTINGLPDGTYRLYEVYVPAGYISTAKYIQFEIENRVMKNVKTDTSDTSAFDFTAAGNNSLALLKIKNTPGAALPNTGGPGTRLFTILGSVLILGAGVLLWRRRRLI
ncbi:MAG: SpaA isopeptide-forming pilin-related protein [Oscillospiraceae bacterium]|nr:SpaA isopeptide-forming pilin-related protein [Oscillospiraceae bacterium]